MNRMMVKAVVTGGLLMGLLQVGSAPPMKPGLWELTTSAKMNMAGQPAAAPRNMKVRSCVTADSWGKSFGQMRQNGNCTVANENRTATHYSFDLSCTANGMKGHNEMDFGADGTSGHGSMHMEMNQGGNAMTMDTTWEGKYLGADCGSVTPEQPQIIP